MKIHVNIETDRTDGLSVHPWTVPGIPMPPIPLPSREGDTAMLTGQGVNKLTTTVKHQFEKIVLEGHDCGRGIKDLTLIPSNGMYPLIWPFSSRQIVFSASTVKMNGAPTGCADMSGFPPIIMTTCGIITSPFARAHTNGDNTVLVGMTAEDVIYGLLGLLLKIFTEIVFMALELIPGEKQTMTALQAILAGLQALIGKFTPASRADLVKWLVGFYNGAIIPISRWASSGKRGKLVIPLPSVWPGGPSSEITYDPATGTWSSKGVPAPVAPTPSPPPPGASPPGSESFEPGGANDQSGTEGWGHPLDPPDNRPGWAYDPNKGWGMP